VRNDSHDSVVVIKLIEVTNLAQQPTTASRDKLVWKTIDKGRAFDVTLLSNANQNCASQEN
jgi:hypothetical protein